MRKRKLFILLSLLKCISLYIERISVIRFNVVTCICLYVATEQVARRAKLSSSKTQNKALQLVIVMLHCSGDFYCISLKPVFYY